MCKPFYNLRVRFAQCEMSQNEVARAAGMASSTMTARMTGAQPFDAWQIEKIAQTLNIPPEEYYKYFFDHKKAAGWITAQFERDGYTVARIHKGETIAANVDLADLWQQTAAQIERDRLQAQLQAALAQLNSTEVEA